MGLFDHLFKTKSPTGDEKVGEHALEANAAAKPPEGAARPQATPRPDPSTFLHPKNSVPRGAPGLTPAPRPSSAVAPKNSERRAATAGPTPGADEIVLTLGDVLSRIPTNYLKPGAHDAKRELRFKINDLSSDIARGRAAVPLSRIAQLAPEIFVKGVSRDEDTEVRLPLQKLVEQIGLLRSRPKAPAVEKTVRPITATEWSAAGKPAVPGEARKPETIEVPAVVEPIAPAATQPVFPPVILAEPAAAQKGVELKPAAEQAAGSVILGPPPVVSEPAAVTLVPAAPSAPPSVPAPVISEATPAVEPVSASPQPAVPIAPTPPEPPTPAPEPRKIVPDWKGDLAAKREVVLEAAAPATPMPEQTVESQSEAVPEFPAAAHLAGPARSEPFLDAPRLAPLESPRLDPSEESIHLGLAAILRTCPPEIIVGQLPHVDDSVRITLPFAPIDRQLVKGQVEVSALRFIASLPDFYQRFFVAKVGVKVPIPLEEVFQNLPSPKHELTPSFTMPPPVVLAPADPAAAAAVPPATVIEEEPVEHAAQLAPSKVLASEVTVFSETASAAPASEAAPVSPVEPPPIFRPAESLHEQPAPVPPVEPPPIPVAVTAPVEPAPTASEEPAPPPSAPAETPVAPPQEPIVPETEPAAAAAAADETPRLFIQPPVFRPHFMPPPPLFGFTAPAVVPAAEPAPAETPAAPVIPSAESVTLESAPAAVPASEAVAPNAPTVIVPVPESASLPGAMATEPPKPEPAAEATPDGEPTVDLMALAGEHEAPDLVQFSSEPVPFSDLSETLAHETTYAPELAEAVRIPEAEPEEPKPAVAAEQPPASADEHRPVPIIEGLAAAAVAATIAEHAPLQFRVGPPMIAPPKIAEPAPVEESASLHPVVEDAEPTEGRAPAHPLDEEPKPIDEATVPIEVPAAEEPVVAEAPVPPPAEPVTPPTPAPAETIPEPETPAAQEPPPSAPPIPGVLTPPPIGLFPLPKLPAEAGPFEVLPPPALPLRRFDQDAVQALFMTEETLDLPKISHLAASLPGVYACVIATRDQACTGGTLPDGFDLAALLGLAPRVGEAAGRMPIGQLKHFTLYGDAYSVSFFERHGLSICAVHRPRSFVPGVREKLVALADELSR